MAKTKPQSNLHFRYRYNSRIKRPSFILLALIALNLVPNTFSSLDTDLLNLHKPQSTQHEHNVAILVSSSTFFHNYRHTTNTLSIYKALKKHGGYTDDNIILFLGDEVACNDRNPFKNKVFPYPDHVENIYEEFHTSSIGGHYSYDGANANGEDDDNDDNNNVQQFYYNDNVQVDYAGSDVTVENFFRVLLGRHNANTPPNQKIPVLNSNNSKTNLLLYMTGHGGDHFFKFRDQEDFTTADLRGAFEQLQIMKRFNSILFISDTCQAFTMAPNTEEEDGMSSSGIVLKNVYTVGTSLKDESSYAHHTDRTIGHSVMDRYVHYFMDYMNGGRGLDGEYSKWSKMDHISLKDALVDSMYYGGSSSIRLGSSSKKLGVDVGYSDRGCSRKMDNIPLSDFLVMKQHPNGEGAELILDRVHFWDVEDANEG